MRNAWLVLKREYMEHVRTKAFLISTILTPVLMIGMMILPGKMIQMKSGGDRSIAVVATPDFGAEVQKKLANKGEITGKNYKVRVVTETTDAQRASLRKEVEGGKLDGFVWATDDELEKHTLNYSARETSDFMEIAEIESALSAANTQRQLSSRGVKPEELDQALKRVKLDTVKVVAGGGESRAGGRSMFLAAIVLVMMIYMTVVIYGITIMRSVLEEKNTRIVEVLLSSLRAKELMAGKILGVGGVGLTQFGVWLALAGGYFFMNAGVIKNSGIEITLPAIIFLPVFFLLGYLLYSAMYAAVGASVNSEQEGQQFQIVIVLPIIVATGLMMGVVTRPNSPMAFWLSMVPFFAPILMYLRIVMQTPPAWEIATCIGIMLVTIYGLLVVCSRIYRVGILMYGKRPTLPELMKWLRYAD